MLPLWAILAVLAAFLQNLRSSVQKRLTGELSTHGATAVRFIYGLPFAILWLGVVAAAAGPSLTLPVPGLRFVLFALAGSLAQIAATTLLLSAFRYRNFAVATAYSKTEGVQVLVLGLVVLGDRVSAGGLAGIVLAVAGVLALSLPRQAGARGRDGQDPRGTRLHVAALGLGAGALFAVASVGYRGAALALGDGHFLLRAAFTLVFALLLQSGLTALRLALVEPGQLTKIARAWRWGVAAGACGAAASAGWFTAFTLTNAAYVKAVGSVELVFALASSRLLFGERASRVEFAGVALVLAGVVMTIVLR